MPGVTGTPISDYGYAMPYSNYGVPVQPNIRRSVGGLAVAVTVFLALDAVFAVLLTAAMAWRHALINRLLADYTSVDEDTMSRSDHLVSSSAGFLAIAYIASVVLFICWFWAARNNAEVYAPHQGTMRVGWSIGGWFIPFANWVIPCIVARDVYKGTMNSRKDKPWGGGQITGWWWAAFVVSSISLSVMSSENKADSDAIDHLQTLRDMAGTAEFAFPVMTVAAALAIGYVWTITKTQKVRNAAGDWPGGPGSETGPGMYGTMPYGYGAPGRRSFGAPVGNGAPTPGYPMPGYPMPMPAPVPNQVPTQDALPVQDAPVQDRVPVAETQVAETQTAEVVSAEPTPPPAQEPGDRPDSGLMPPS
jgi:hypothetical protein